MKSIVAQAIKLKLLIVFVSTLWPERHHEMAYIVTTVVVLAAAVTGHSSHSPPIWSLFECTALLEVRKGDKQENILSADVDWFLEDVEDADCVSADDERGEGRCLRIPRGSWAELKKEDTNDLGVDWVAFTPAVHRLDISTIRLSWPSTNSPT